MARVMIMAGGTGGHVFPALAVAELLRRHDIDIEWIGTRKGIENKLVPNAGYPIHLIGVEGLRGNGFLGWLLAPYRISKAIFQAYKALAKKPVDVVLGLGGFASGPGGIAAWLMRKPLVIHEQNAIPGLTNALLAKIATRVLQGFPNSFQASVQAQWVGNPVRSDIGLVNETAREYEDGTPLNVLVLGGSLGAKTLNELIPLTIAKLSPNYVFNIRHQCGERHLKQCQEHYQKAEVSAQISAFIEDMAAAYRWADIVICRSGALTVAELAASASPSILIPYPYAVDDHQTLNGSQLVKVGAAVMIDEANLTMQQLARLLEVFYQDRQQLTAMSHAANQQSKPEATQDIAEICMELCHG